jgi:exopolysaccharide biosynthesis polyprenyl glycosylphosphotransferase
MPELWYGATRWMPPQATVTPTVSAEAVHTLAERSGPLPSHETSRLGRPVTNAGRAQAYRIGLAFADVLALLTAATAVTVVGGSDWLRPSMLLLLPLIVLLAKLSGLYDRDEAVVHKTSLDQTPALLQLALAVTMIFWLGERLFVYGQLGHAQALSFVLLLCFCLVAFRAVARRLVAQMLEPERVLFVGDQRSYERLSASLMQHCARSTQLVGSLDIRSGQLDPDTQEASLAAAIEEIGVSRIVVAAGEIDPGVALELVRVANSLGVRVSVLPRVLDVIGGAVAFDELSGMTLLGVPRFGLSRSSYRIKRAFDLLGASVALAFTAPLFALTAVAIKLDSRGPVFFRQDRVGRDGRRFRMTKFRTMITDADDQKGALRAGNETVGLFKIAADPRVTRVGRLLRRCSLDELPQLINVWRGQMSLVGPRPLVVDEDAAVTGYDRDRLVLMPGITGPWQILRAQRVPLSEMVKIDYLYVATWSLWTDVKILIRTMRHVLLRWGL